MVEGLAVTVVRLIVGCLFRGDSVRLAVSNKGVRGDRNCHFRVANHHSEPTEEGVREGLIQRYVEKFGLPR
jgi:hypothetical protein